MSGFAVGQSNGAEKVAKANAEEAARRAARLAVPQKVYVIGSGSYVKIGIARDVRKRVSMLQISSPVPLTVIKLWECDDAYEVERRLHKKYAEFKTSGEWFAMPESVLRDLVAMKSVKSDDLGLSRTPGASSCW